MRPHPPHHFKTPMTEQALTLPELLSLRSGDLILELAPATGGSVAAFYSAASASRPRLDWLRPASGAALAARDPLGMASFPLIPWCNRLRDGRAVSHGHAIRLEPNFQDSPHTIHGLAWQRPWELSQSSADAATLTFSYEPEVQPADAGAAATGWPWAFSAWQTFRLDAQGFACQLTLRNDSSELMPFGLGHHPYFPHPEGTRLQCDFSELGRMWESDAQCMPTGLGQPAFLDELRQGIELAQLDLDNNFTGWQRRFRVDWPEPQRQLTLTAASPLDFFVLYCPKGEAFFCAEPVSNCTDWLNLQGEAGVGNVRNVGGGELAPGASFSTTFRIDVALAQPR